MRELSRHIGDNTDVPAGDIGVSPTEIGYMFVSRPAQPLLCMSSQSCRTGSEPTAGTVTSGPACSPEKASTGEDPSSVPRRPVSA